MGAYSVLQRWLSGVKGWVLAILPRMGETRDLEGALDHLAFSRQYLLSGGKELVGPFPAARGELQGVTRVSLSRADREIVESLLVLHQELRDIVYSDNGHPSGKLK